MRGFVAGIGLWLLAGGSVRAQADAIDLTTIQVKWGKKLASAVAPPAKDEHVSAKGGPLQVLCRTFKDNLAAGDGLRLEAACAQGGPPKGPLLLTLGVSKRAVVAKLSLEVGNAKKSTVLRTLQLAPTLAVFANALRSPKLPEALATWIKASLPATKRIADHPPPAPCVIELPDHPEQLVFALTFPAGLGAWKPAIIGALAGNKEALAQICGKALPTPSVLYIFDASVAKALSDAAETALAEAQETEGAPPKSEVEFSARQNLIEFRRVTDPFRPTDVGAHGGIGARAVWMPLSLAGIAASYSTIESSRFENGEGILTYSMKRWTGEVFIMPGLRLGTIEAAGGVGVLMGNETTAVHYIVNTSDSTSDLTGSPVLPLAGLRVRGRLAFSQLELAGEYTAFQQIHAKASTYDLKVNEDTIEGELRERWIAHRIKSSLRFGLGLFALRNDVTLEGTLSAFPISTTVSSLQFGFLAYLVL